MAIERWEPFRDMVSLRDAVSSLLQESFVRPGGMAGGGAAALPLDVHETETEFVVKASLPGVKPEDVKLSLENNMLTIRGEKKQVAEEKADRVHRYERSYGVFERAFALPSTVDAEKIEARYDAGVLTVDMPKAERARPRQIAVKTS